MFFLLPYSCSMVDSPNRSDRVFHDLAASPATPTKTTSVMATVRGVMRNLMVLITATNSTNDIMVTPAREMVITSATSAKGMAQAQTHLSGFGNCEVKAVTSRGVVVQSSTDKLLD